MTTVRLRKKHVSLQSDHDIFESSHRRHFRLYDCEKVLQMVFEAVPANQLDAAHIWLGTSESSLARRKRCAHYAARATLSVWPLKHCPSIHRTEPSIQPTIRLSITRHRDQLAWLKSGHEAGGPPTVNHANHAMIDTDGHYTSEDLNPPSASDKPPSTSATRERER